jgi:hypothetical protein
MNKHEILKAAKRYSDVAFCQGYEAKTQNIPKDANGELAQMTEALDRINAFQDLINVLNEQDNSPIIFEQVI